jgi:peptidoglycan/LPS O-acetylase OafA/YrhL
MEPWNPIFALGTMTLWIISLNGFLRIKPDILKVNHHVPAQDLRVEAVRGLMAILVVTYHAYLNFEYMNTSRWLPKTVFIAKLGSEPVRVFFTLTGFLFWRKLLQNESMPPLGFLKKRFRRLMPAYYASLLTIVAIAYASRNAGAPQGSLELTRNLLRWITVGLPNGNFPDLFGMEKTWMINAGVFWTLRWEWLFYFFVPIAAIWGSRVRTWVAIGACGAIGLLPLLLDTSGDDVLLKLVTVASIGACSFGPGILLAHLLTDPERKDFGYSFSWSGIIRLSLGTAILAAPFEIGIFYVLLTAWTVYAALSTRLCHTVLVSPGIQFLGSRSYSVYLIHGFCLTGIRHVQPHFPAISGNSYFYWSIVCLVAGPVLFGLANLSFLWLESPFISKRA